MVGTALLSGGLLTWVAVPTCPVESLAVNLAPPPPPTLQGLVLRPLLPARLSCCHRGFTLIAFLQPSHRRCELTVTACRLAGSRGSLRPGLASGGGLASGLRVYSAHLPSPGPGSQGLVPSPVCDGVRAG